MYDYCGESSGYISPASCFFHQLYQKFVIPFVLAWLGGQVWTNLLFTVLLAYVSSWILRDTDIDCSSFCNSVGSTGLRNNVLRILIHFRVDILGRCRRLHFPLSIYFYIIPVTVLENWYSWIAGKNLSEFYFPVQNWLYFVMMEPKLLLDKTAFDLCLCLT